MYEFDLKTLWNTLWGHRKMIIRNCVIGGVVAIVVAYSLPKEYSSDVVLAAEDQNESSLSGSAASLASLAGIKLGSATDAIAPNLYPNVVSSNEFIVNILNSEVETVDGEFKGTYQQYLQQYQKSAWWNYPFKMVRKLIQSMKSDSGGEVGGITDPLRLSKSENDLVEGVRSQVICSVDEEYGTISISAFAQDPLVARILVDSATIKLQDFITKYRTNKARIDLKYYQGLEHDAMLEYREAQQNFADFQDSHRDVQLQSFINERNRLESDLQLAFTAYSQMKQQVIMAVAKVQENTPVFTVIEAACVPSLPDSPRKKLIFIAFLFVTAVGTLGWIYFKLLFSPKANQQ